MKNPNKPNIYDYVLSMFKSNDSLRPAFCQIFKNENYYCGTDSHALIIAETSLTGLTYNDVEKAPNALKVYNDAVTDTELILDRNELLSDFFSAEQVWKGEKLSCDECEGKGYKTCRCCGTDNDCEDCDGTGESFLDVPFSKATLYGEVVKLCETTFNTFLLNKVIQTAFFLEENKIIARYKKGSPRSSVTFEIGKVKILLMPQIPTN